VIVGIFIIHSCKLIYSD